MENFITAELVTKAKESTPLHLGNSVLYDLCSEYFEHDSADKILAKTLLIGRSYAVALDRRKNKKHINDDFYLKKVVPKFMYSNIDQQLKKLKPHNTITKDNIKDILSVHYYLTKLINPLTKQNKRSFSSKYLHFHFPKLFFLFDSRAEAAFWKKIRSVPPELSRFTKLNKVDPKYAAFFCKCFHLSELIKNKTELKVELSPREIDNFLLNIGNRKLRKKRY